MIVTMATLAAHAVDLAHLDRYTGGVRTLNEEVLRLFEKQCLAMVGDLETAAELGDAKNWRLLAHTLKGAARGVGAVALGDAAAAAEKTDIADKAAAAHALTAIAGTARDVHLFIERFLG
jgi:HPt (histidine-containing phosphotransfer) domain-containing protein